MTLVDQPFNTPYWNAGIGVSEDGTRFRLRLPVCPDFPKGKSVWFSLTPEDLEKAVKLLKSYTRFPKSPQAKQALRDKVAEQIRSGALDLPKPKPTYSNPLEAKAAQRAVYDESQVRRFVGREAIPNLEPSAIAEIKSMINDRQRPALPHTAQSPGPASIRRRHIPRS